MENLKKVSPHGLRRIPASIWNLCMGVALLSGMAFVAIGCTKQETPNAKPKAAATALPADLPQGLLIAMSRFDRDGKGELQTLPARLVILTRKSGTWSKQIIDDPESNVFHKAMFYDPPYGEPGILTVGAEGAALKIWRKAKAGEGFEAETLWKPKFGGKFDRLRDVEVGNLYGGAGGDLAVVTHDQGVIATVHPKSDGSYEVRELDRRTQDGPFVHEVEIGDLDGDGMSEVYVTPSAPNKMDGTPQPGKVLRYVPGKNEGGVVVADLGNRHAKEILVRDVDGDGRDELYVSVEDPVEILRFEANTKPTAGVRIGELNDRYSRFLTSGDFAGDGKPMLIAATYKRGLWLFRPNLTKQGEWQRDVIDRESGGIEHAAIALDLDGDGRDELYVASDTHAELRRYVWSGNAFVREVVDRRDYSAIVWNLMPVPREFVD